jgi:hypothetical protein
MFRWTRRLLRRGETQGQADATEALRAAQEARDETERRGPEVASVADQLRQIRQRNHFAEAFDALLHQRGGA